MTQEELENNLGIIAKSGSLAFKRETEVKDGHEIIGQFGVGFYSAFMVADKVTVISKSLLSDQAYKWESEGSEGYTIEPATKELVGTEIILSSPENTEEAEAHDFLHEYRPNARIHKYSDSIRYALTVDVPVRRPDEGKEDEFASSREEQVITSMVPIW